MVKKDILLNILHYTLSTFINKGLMFIMLPLISYFLVPEEYAIYSLLLLFSAIMALFYQAGIQQSLMTFYHKKNESGYKFSLVGTSYLIIFLISFLFIILIINSRTYLTEFILNVEFPKISHYEHLFNWFAFIIFFNVFTGITLVLPNVRQESKHFTILSFTNNVIYFALLIFAVLTKQLTLIILVKILFISSFVSAIHSTIYVYRIMKSLRREVESKLFSTKILFEIMPFSIVLIPATLSLLILQSADRYMLNILSPNSLKDTGIYAVSYKVGMILSLLTSVFDLVFFPFILKLGNSSAAKYYLKKVFNFFVIIGSSLGIIIITFSQEIFLLFEGSYLEGAKYVFAGVISIFFNGIARIILIGLYILHKSKKITLGIIIGAALNIILNFILIPQYRILGASIASVISYGIIVVYDLYVTEKCFYVGYNKTMLLVGTTIMLIMSWLNFIYVPTAFSLIIKLIIFIFVFGIILFSVKYNEKYKTMYKDLKRSIKE